MGTQNLTGILKEVHVVNSSTPVTFLGMLMDRNTRWNFLCEATNAALVGVFLGITGPFTLPLAIRLGATPFMVWFMTSGPFIGNFLSPLWVGLSRGRRQVPWVVVPHLIWRGGMGMIGLLNSPAAIVATHVATNVTVAAANPAYGAVVQKVFPAQLRGRLMGYVRLMLAAAMLVTTLVAGRILDGFGHKWIYLTAGLFGLVAIGVYAMTKEPMDEAGAAKPRKPGVLDGLRQAFADPLYRRFLLAAVLFHGGALVAQPLYSQFQVREMGLSNTQISYLTLSWNIAWLCAFAYWGRVIDRKGPRMVVVAAAAFYLGMPLAYGLGGSVFAAVAVGHMAQGVADAALDLGGWNIILATNPDRVAAYTSAHLMMTAVRGAFGPLLGSSLLGIAGFQLTFLMAAALVAVGLFLFVSQPKAKKGAVQV